jgi:predicted nucleic acid-binding protein
VNLRSQRPGFVVDASVVLKWFILAEEEELQSAYLLRNDYKDRAVDLFAPDLLIYEVANVLRYKNIPAEIIEKALASLYAMDFLVPVRHKTMTEAVRIARRFDVTVYDSIYISLALACGCRMVTADLHFIQKLKNMPGVLHISEYKSDSR